MGHCAGIPPSRSGPGSEGGEGNEGVDTSCPAAVPAACTIDPAAPTAPVPTVTVVAVVPAVLAAVLAAPVTESSGGHRLGSADEDICTAEVRIDGSTSGGHRCEIDVRHGGGAAFLEIRDDGLGHPAAQPGSGGHGLRGLAERTTAVGGTLAAGPRAGGGYRLAVSLPAATREEITA